MSAGQRFFLATWVALTVMAACNFARFTAYYGVDNITFKLNALWLAWCCFMLTWVSTARSDV